MKNNVEITAPFFNRHNLKRIKYTAYQRKTLTEKRKRHFPVKADKSYARYTNRRGNEIPYIGSFFADGPA